MSSIPARDQRSFLSELREIAAWLRDPANAGEFLLIFLDDQSDLETFGEVPHLLEHITSVFGTEVFTPRDLAVAREGEGVAGPSAWPSMGEMGRMGRRVLFMSGARYRGSEDLMFVKDDVCGWAEPAVEDLREWPSCGGGELDRSLVRVNACELQVGGSAAHSHHRSGTDVAVDASAPAVRAAELRGPSRAERRAARPGRHPPDDAVRTGRRAQRRFASPTDVAVAS